MKATMMEKMFIVGVGGRVGRTGRTGGVAIICGSLLVCFVLE